MKGEQIDLRDTSAQQDVVISMDRAVAGYYVSMSKHGKMALYKLLSSVASLYLCGIKEGMDLGNEIVTLQADPFRTSPYGALHYQPLAPPSISEPTESKKKDSTRQKRKIRKKR